MDDISNEINFRIKMRIDPKCRDQNAFLPSTFFQEDTEKTLTLCLVGGIIGRTENKERKIGWKTVFSTVWHTEENVEDGKPE